MTFREELLTYIDADGLVGDRPRAAIRSGGNQLLETWTGWVLMSKAGVLEAQDMADIVQATHHCEVYAGIFDKNPPLADGTRRMDDITHDDIIGVSMGSSILGSGFEVDIARVGASRGWRMSNTAKWYWTASAKPWHRAAYMLAAGQKPDDWSLGTLVLAILFDAFFQMDDAGGKRLTWLILEALERRHWAIALAGRVWRYRVGSIKKIFTALKGADHPFAKYAP